MVSAATAGGAPAAGIRPSTSPVSPAAMTLRCERVCLFIAEPSVPLWNPSTVRLPLSISILDISDNDEWQAPCRGCPRAKIQEIEGPEGDSRRDQCLIGARGSGPHCAALVNDHEPGGQY
jgi:hypothetical protein